MGSNSAFKGLKNAPAHKVCVHKSTRVREKVEIW